MPLDFRVLLVQQGQQVLFKHVAGLVVQAVQDRLEHLVRPAFPDHQGHLAARVQLVYLEIMEKQVFPEFLVVREDPAGLEILALLVLPDFQVQVVFQALPVQLVSKVHLARLAFRDHLASLAVQASRVQPAFLAHLAQEVGPVLQETPGHLEGSEQLVFRDLMDSQVLLDNKGGLEGREVLDHLEPLEIPAFQDRLEQQAHLVVLDFLDHLDSLDGLALQDFLAAVVLQGRQDHLDGLGNQDSKDHRVILVLAAGLEGLVFLALMEILDFQVLLDLQVKLDLLELLDRLDNLAFQEKRDFRDLPASQAAGVSPDPPVLDASLEPPDILDNLEALVVRDLLDFRAHLDLLDGPERPAFRVLQDHQVDLVSEDGLGSLVRQDVNSE